MKHLNASSSQFPGEQDGRVRSCSCPACGINKTFFRRFSDVFKTSKKRLKNFSLMEKPLFAMVMGGGVTPPQKTTSDQPCSTAYIALTSFPPARGIVWGREGAGDGNEARAMAKAISPGIGRRTPNNPAYLLTCGNSFRCQPPATSASVTRCADGARNADHKGEPMIAPKLVQVPMTLASECLSLLSALAYDHKTRLDTAEALAAHDPALAADIKATSSETYRRAYAAASSLRHYLTGGVMQ